MEGSSEVGGTSTLTCSPPGGASHKVVTNRHCPIDLYPPYHNSRILPEAALHMDPLHTSPSSLEIKYIQTLHILGTSNEYTQVWDKCIFKMELIKPY